MAFLINRITAPQAEFLLHRQNRLMMSPPPREKVAAVARL
jgi:hypothetical protein